MNIRPVRDLAGIALRVPVFVKIMGIAVGLTVTFAVAMSWQIHRTLGRIVEHDIELRARLAAADIASHGAHHWAEGDRTGLERVLLDARARTPDLVYAFVVDVDGARVAGFEPPSGEVRPANAPGSNGEPRLVRLDAAGGPILDVAVPIAMDRGGWVPPVFTDFTYDNLGVPKNLEYPLDPVAPVDLGLGPIVGDPEENGKFKVMTVRNIGLSAPYAHNGLFKSLKEIVHFYNTRDVAGALPGGMDWPEPEYPFTVNFDELGNLGLSDADEDALVEFMTTLDDGWRP